MYATGRLHLGTFIMCSEKSLLYFLRAMYEMHISNAKFIISPSNPML